MIGENIKYCVSGEETCVNLGTTNEVQIFNDIKFVDDSVDGVGLMEKLLIENKLTVPDYLVSYRVSGYTLELVGSDGDIVLSVDPWGGHELNYAFYGGTRGSAKVVLEWFDKVLSDKKKLEVKQKGGYLYGTVGYVSFVYDSENAARSRFVYEDDDGARVVDVSFRGSSTKIGTQIWNYTQKFAKLM